MVFHPEDAYGMKVGHLTAVEPVIKNFHASMTWRFRCDCGQIVKERLSKVLNGYITSCGCSPEDASLIPKEHVQVAEYDRLAAVWKRIRLQCNTPSYASYGKYGARGIRVEWSDYHSFRAWAIAAGYTEDPGKRYAIRRKDENGNFGPENCYWQVYAGNAHHVGELVCVQGVKHTIHDWCELLGVGTCCVYTARGKGIPPWMYIRYRLTFPDQKRPRPEAILQCAGQNGWREEACYE